MDKEGMYPVGRRVIINKGARGRNRQPFPESTSDELGTVGTEGGKYQDTGDPDTIYVVPDGHAWDRAVNIEDLTLLPEGTDTDLKVGDERVVVANARYAPFFGRETHVRVVGFDMDEDLVFNVIVEELGGSAEYMQIVHPDDLRPIHEPKDEDAVNHPAHYTYLKDKLGGLEVIDILEAFFPHEPLLWQVGKYMLRAGHKGSMLEDLSKARWYLDRRIAQEEEKE